MDKVDVQQRALALTMLSVQVFYISLRHSITRVKFRWRETEVTQLCTSGK
jgi:hypothetical protein